MTWRWTCLLVGMVALGSGCATSRALCPEEGGRPWREVRSQHFRVQTNLDSKAAAKSAVEMEEFRRSLLLAWGDQFDPPGTLDVILVSNLEELREFAHDQVGGFVAITTTGLTMVMTGAGGYLFADTSGDKATQAHELAHYLSAFALPRQPRWLAEGLAEYLETVTIKPSTRDVVLGRVDLRNVGYLRAHGWLSVEELWDWDKNTDLDAAEQRRHYASAWLWVHYLINEHGDRFADFENRLARGEEPRNAYSAAFKGVPNPGEGLPNYIQIGRYAVLTQPLPAVNPQVQEHPMTPAEVHSVRARLFKLAPSTRTPQETQALFERELAQALKEDSTSVAANQLYAETLEKPEQQLARARPLVQQHPEDGRAWLMLAESLRATGSAAEEQEKAFQRAVELLPDSPTAHNGLAWFYANTTHPERGLAAAARAVALKPGDSAILDTYAALLFQTHRCPEALALQQRAVDMIHERAPATFRGTLEQRRAQYEAACAKPSTPKP
ncbi:DUF1570 domain-containing protein [Myxococcaceae bacterium JPH2]|nr:DUF1570 domain-containing protein [Myxococcaceae bacterium JPH2]